MRVIPLSEYSARRAASLTESMLYSKTSTLAFFKWKPSITLPYMQTITDINLEACAAHNIEIARITGGGRAFVHGDDISFALVRQMENIDVTKELNWICEKACAALKELGINAQIKHRIYQRNGKEITDGYDVEINGKILAGYAAKIKEDNTGDKNVLIHGSFFYNKPTVENWPEYFNIPKELDKKEMVKQIESNITHLLDHTKASPESICQMLAKHIMPEHELSSWYDEEKEFAINHETELYSGDKWKEGEVPRGICQCPWPLDKTTESLRKSMKIKLAQRHRT